MVAEINSRVGAATQVEVGNRNNNEVQMASQRNGRGNSFGNETGNGQQNHYQNQQQGQNQNSHPSQDFSQSFNSNQGRGLGRGRGRGDLGGSRGAWASHDGPQQNAQNHSSNHYPRSISSQNPFATSKSGVQGDLSSVNCRSSGPRGGGGGRGGRGGRANFSNTQEPHWQTAPPHGGFSGRGRARSRDGGRGRHSTPFINPFHHSTPPVKLEVIGYDNYDNYDADDSSSADNGWLSAPPHKHGWPVVNPLEQITSSLDHFLFQLINNTPQYRSTIRRFMDGYTGPEDLEFWMNTMGVEHMNWEVLHEVDRLGLQFPPGWNCVAREFEERRMESNYSRQDLGGVITGGPNLQQPDYSYANSFRSERHWGTFATPAGATLRLHSDPPPVGPKFALPGTQTIFSWNTEPQVPPANPRIIAPTMPSAMRHDRIPPADSYRFGSWA